jgi:hypothetical protein
MMPTLFSTTANVVFKATEHAEATVNSLSVAGKDVMAAQAQDTTQAGIMPLGVIIAILVGLLTSGFLLLLHESKVEKRKSRG